MRTTRVRNCDMRPSSPPRSGRHIKQAQVPTYRREDSGGAGWAFARPLEPDMATRGAVREPLCHDTFELPPLRSRLRAPRTRRAQFWL